MLKRERVTSCPEVLPELQGEDDSRKLQGLYIEASRGYDSTVGIVEWPWTVFGSSRERKNGVVCRLRKYDCLVWRKLGDLARCVPCEENLIFREKP